MAAAAIFASIQKQNQRKQLLNHGHFKMWHGKLFKDVVPVHYYAGNYRSAELRHPCLNVNNEVNGVQGAPFQDVPEMMARFSKTLESATIDTDDFVGGQKTPEVKLKAAAQIAAFTAGTLVQIHPFLNGNGRIARFAANFFFDRYGFRMPFFIERPPEADYGTAFSMAMRDGNFSSLFQYFVALIAA